MGPARSSFVSLLVVAAVVSSACEIVTPTSPYDPETPPERQAEGSLRGAIVLRDASIDGVLVGERAALGRITVGLRDAAGRPVARDGVAVVRTLVDIDDAFAADAGRGSFVFDGLTPGEYTLVIAGLPPGYGVAGAIAAVVAPAADANVGDIEFVYVLDGDDGFVIEGQTATAGPAAGPQTVSLFRANDGVVSFVGAAASAGSFRFGGLQPGNYGLLVEGQGQMPSYRLDIPVDSTQPRRAFAGAAAITLHPVTAVLLPVTSGAGAVVNVEGENYVRDAPVPLAVLGFSDDVGVDVGISGMRLSTSDRFVDDDGAEVAFTEHVASTTFALPARDGRHTIHAQFEAQSAGGFRFTSPTFALDVVRDTVPPSIDAATLPGLRVVNDVAMSASRVVPLRALVHDATSALAAFGVGVDGAPGELGVVVAAPGDVQLERSITFAEDGLHTLHLVARDRARNDNADAPALVQIHVDTVAPAVTLTIENATGGVLPAAEALLKIVSTIPGDDDLLVGFGFEGQLITPGAPVVAGVEGPTATGSVRLPADARPGGSFTFEAVVVDVVGNETRVTQTVNLPPAPSAPQIVINGGAASTNDRNVRLRLAARDFTRVRVTEGAHEAFFEASAVDDEEVDFRLATEAGDAVVTADFFDAAGNSVSASDSILVDVDPPTLAGPVRLNGGAESATSVSANLTVNADDADQMAVVVADGGAPGAIDVAALTFQPYAVQSIVLLPSGDGAKTVCVVLRDAAGNLIVPAETADACATIALDTTAPSSPVTISEDGQVLQTPSSRVFPLEIAPLDDDVDHVAVTVEVPFGDARQPPPREFQVALAPRDGVDCVAGQVCVLGVPVTGSHPDTPDTPHLFRLTAIDRAGNASAQATFTVTYDDKVPDVPALALADEIVLSAGPPRVVSLKQGPAGFGQTGPVKLNADSVALRWRGRLREVDRNFDHYEVARTVGKRVIAGTLVVRTPRDGLRPDGLPDVTSVLRPDPTDLPYTEAAGADTLLVPLVQGAPLNGTANLGRMCTPRACLNHIFVRAIDAAGNIGPELRIDIIEDSGPPTRPTLSPRGGAMVGAEAAVRLDEVSVDDSDFCDDSRDCRAGLACVDTQCVAPGVVGGVPVGAYELKEGNQGRFGGVPPGQPTAGPYRLQLVRGQQNTLCARGVDQAGNVGIEDCIDVHEQSRAPRIVLADAGATDPRIAGDSVVYRIADRMYLHDLVGPASTETSDDQLLDGLMAPRNRGAASTNAIAVSVGVEDGGDHLAIAVQGDMQGNDIIQLRFGRPRLRVIDPPSTEMTTRFAQRSFRGAAPSLLGRSLTFACVRGDGRTQVMSADVGAIFDGGPPDGVVVGDVFFAPPQVFTNCPAVDASGTFSTVTTLPAGRRLCTNTSPVATSAGMAWCETSSSDDGETGTIVALPSSGSASIVQLGEAARSSHGRLVDDGVGFPIRPVASAGRLAWVGATGTIVDLRATPGASPRDTGIAAGDLYQLDGDVLVYAAVRDDGLTDDLYVVDLGAARPAPVRLSDDLPPNTDGSLSGGRLVFTALSARGESIDMIRLGEDGWLASSDTLRFQPATSPTRAAWIELVDDELALVSVDINSGEHGIAARGQDLLGRLTFFGGSFLGNAPVQVTDRFVVAARRNVVDDVPVDTWTVSLFPHSVSFQQPGTVEIDGIAAAAPVSNREATLAFAVDGDGDTVAYVERATGNLLVRRLDDTTLAPTTIVTQPSGRGDTDATMVPYVTVDDVGGLTVAVWQLGNDGNNGDVRRDRTGALQYVERRNDRVTRAEIRTEAGQVLRGRAPSVAIVDGRPVLAWQTVTPASTPSGGGFVFRRTRACELAMVGNGVVCRNERALDEPTPPLERGGDSGAPVVSRNGFVVWANGAERQQPQVDVYTLATNTRASLTGALGDDLRRDAVAAAGDVVVWIDGRLGTSDIWYATVP